jgi:ribosomal 30S subunit maturation factor RimM
VQVSRADFPALPEDEYYWSDLIGLDVVNLQGEALGKVTDMMHNGAQSILRIRRRRSCRPGCASDRAAGAVRGPVRQDRRLARQS